MAVVRSFRRFASRLTSRASRGHARASRRAVVELQPLESRTLMNADVPCGVLGPPTVTDLCPSCGANFDSAPGQGL